MHDDLFATDGLVQPAQQTGRTRRRTAAPNVANDPLSAKQAKSLLTSSGVIRDPLHHDIRVTSFERTLIDTRAFQRLRLVNQLAMVDSVYPGAVHTRFLHSVGTLHVCSDLILACNNTVKTLRPLAPLQHPVPMKIGPYAELLARLVALLHDMAHVPFGHVFEREAQVFKKDEWADEWRVKQTLGVESEFADAFRKSMVQHFRKSTDAEPMEGAAGEEAANRILREVRDVLVAKGRAVLDLRYPFVYDLVSNTICADLIDYVRRDMFFCGLTEGLATRFLRHIGILPVEYPTPAGSDELVLRPVRVETGEDYARPREERAGKAIVSRVVLLQYSYNRRHAATTKDNVLSEAIDLVRRRKLVAEKLYFHKTKLTATSMLAAAAYASGITSAERIWDKTDHEVLTMIATTPDDHSSSSSEQRSKRARRLAQCLLDRRFFKPIYRVSWHPNNDDETAKRLWQEPNGAYPRHNTAVGKERLIEELESVIGWHANGDSFSAAGTVSVSCPNKEMQLKEFEMLVLQDPATGEVKPLEATVRPTVKEEIEVIKKQHQELWRLEVFVDVDVVDLDDPFARKLAGAIAHEIGLPNEVGEFASATPMPLANLVKEERVNHELTRLGLRDRITEVHHTQLIEQSARGQESIQDQLREWKYLS
jgi:uncharacterized protein